MGSVSGREPCIGGLDGSPGATAVSPAVVDQKLGYLLVVPENKALDLIKQRFRYVVDEGLGLGAAGVAAVWPDARHDRLVSPR
jgi:hypothetical protein